LQAFNAIIDLGERRQEYCRRAYILHAQCAYDIQPIAARHAAIDDKDFIAAASRELQSVFAIMRHVDHMIVLAQKLCGVVRRGAIIFHEQNVHGS
jgi:hypothetical protein